MSSEEVSTRVTQPLTGANNCVKRPRGRPRLRPLGTPRTPCTPAPPQPPPPSQHREHREHREATHSSQCAVQKGTESAAVARSVGFARPSHHAQSAGCRQSAGSTGSASSTLCAHATKSHRRKRPPEETDSSSTDADAHPPVDNSLSPLDRALQNLFKPDSILVEKILLQVSFCL